ncbi:DDB1- and CUL4-associated factor 12 [Oopsacas minuta]|uniref:DDB1- and CUL4-associated factor 12 n=1 Tax=Oopsacas minuta TaxID=111878 RepID=A0AAV7KAW4_9METZ|nr:DDB1- and CUL4-associated factor 12 [Oopsacas minuta]
MASDWLTSRNFRNSTGISKSIQELAAKKNVSTLKEYCNDLGDSNKVFCSHWLDNRNILCGTKCNKLWLVDSETNYTYQIPTLFPSKRDDSGDSYQDQCSNSHLVSRGIHAIGINESNTCLAVSGGFPEDVAFYSLPDLSPLGLGVGHQEWIFSLTWLKNSVLITGANDGQMQLWDASQTFSNYNSIYSEHCPTIEPIASLENKPEDARDKIRSLVYSERLNALASLQTGYSRAALSLWDVELLKPIYRYDLSHCAENVCMKYNPEHNIFGIGSRQAVTLFDPREWPSSDNSKEVVSIDKSWGVRSIAYNEHILSIGTGRGNVYFFDLRAWRYLETDEGEHLALRTSEGWIRHDNNYYTFFNSIPKLPNAIYSHSYSPDNRKMYIAGGPLQLGLCGNYSSIWQ